MTLAVSTPTCRLIPSQSVENQVAVFRHYTGNHLDGTITIPWPIGERLSVAVQPKLREWHAQFHPDFVEMCS